MPHNSGANIAGRLASLGISMSGSTTVIHSVWRVYTNFSNMQIRFSHLSSCPSFHSELSAYEIGRNRRRHMYFLSTKSLGHYRGDAAAKKVDSGYRKALVASRNPFFHLVQDVHCHSHLLYY